MAFFRDRKRAAKDARDAEVAFHARIADSTGDGACRFSFDTGRILLANKGWARMLDLDLCPDELKGKQLSEVLVYTEKPGTVREAVDRHGEIHGSEYHFQTLKGEPRWVVLDAFIVRDAHTGDRAVELIARDVTAAKLHESGLRHLNAVLAALREVGQALVSSGDKQELISKVPEKLVKSGGYLCAWIVLKENGTERINCYGEGFEEDGTRSLEEIDRSARPACLEKLPAPEASGIFSPRVEICRACFFSCGDGPSMLAPLSYGSQFYGAVCVTLPEASSGPAGYDRTLFLEIASDISFALHDLELEEEKQRKSEELLRYRDHLEQLVSERKSQLEMIGEAIPYGVWTCNEHGGIEYLSGSFLELIGMSMEEARDEGWTRALREESVEKVMKDWKDCVARGCEWNYEYELLGADGAPRTVLSRGFPIRGDNGDITSWAGINLDITERKRSERKLERSREYLREIINSVADPIFVKDSSHRWIMLNDALCQLLGYDREVLIGKSDHDFFPKEEADVFWEKDERVFQTGEENVNEENLTDADGRTHTIITKKRLYVDEQGDKILVGVIRDITERKEMEEELKASEARYRALFDKNPAATVLVDEDLSVVMVNRQFELLSGYSRKEIVGRRSLLDLIDEPYRDKVRSYHQLRMIDPSAPPQDYEVSATTSSGGRRRLMVNITMVPYTQQSMVSFLDITELKEKEFELNKQKEILDSTNKALQHKLEELENAMKHIKRLEGLVPICAHCKKMFTEEKGPDEPGNWVPLEEYISERSEAKFTHGLCPECITRLYGKTPKRRKNDI